MVMWGKQGSWRKVTACYQRIRSDPRRLSQIWRVFQVVTWTDSQYFVELLEQFAD